MCPGHDDHLEEEAVGAAVLLTSSCLACSELKKTTNIDPYVMHRRDIYRGIHTRAHTHTYIM